MARKLPLLSGKVKAQKDYQKTFDMQTIPIDRKIVHTPSDLDAVFFDESRRQRTDEGKMIFPYDFIIEVWNRGGKVASGADAVYFVPPSHEHYQIILRVTSEEDYVETREKVESKYKEMFRDKITIVDGYE